MVKGTVTVKSSQGGQITKARLGSKVLPGDIIITDADSRAKIVMVDNNEINVSPNSQIEIQKYEFDPTKNKKDVLLNVIYGKVRSKVEQKYDGKTTKFQVKTPSAVAGVRGTDFLAGYASATGVSQIVTFEGRVEFGIYGPNGQILNPVFVAPGQMAEIGRGGMPAKPTEMPKGDLEQMNTDTNSDSAAAPKAPTPVADSGSTKSEPAKDDRQPSSTPGPTSSSMIQNNDLPTAPSSEVHRPPQINPNPLPPLITRQPNAQPCDLICQNGQKGNALLKITVKNQ